MNVPLYVAVMAALVLMSGYFSATETAFSSFNKTRLKTLAEKGNKRAKLALKLEEKYDRLLSTILIGNNIVNIALASMGTILFAYLLSNQDLGATVSTVVITVVVLIFGEITPKNLAKEHSEKFAMFSAPIIQFIGWILLPLTLIFAGWKKLISLIFKNNSDNKMSTDELLMLVEEVEQDGSIDEEEGELLRNVIEFTDLEAKDILTHRVDLEAVSIDSSKEEIADIFTKTRFSRLVVYEESIDNVVGVIHSKDFYVGSGVYPRSIKEIITPALFIHKTEKISDLLKKLQNEKSHIAIVLDEYGGTLGIVTMEDILEELVGEIWDEHDEVVEDVEKLEREENAYMVDGTMNFDDFCDEFDLDRDEEIDSVSVGGWITEQLGKIPSRSDRFDYKHIHVIVTETDSHRVVKAKVLVFEKPEDDYDEKDKED
jgi:CBS domain containing-hemolysin-like protein